MGWVAREAHPEGKIRRLAERGEGTTQRATVLKSVEHELDGDDGLRHSPTQRWSRLPIWSV